MLYGFDLSSAQALRPVRHRVAPVGSEVTQTDRDEWWQQQDAFLRPRLPPTACSLDVQKVRRQVAIPRLATYDWLTHLQNALGGGVGHGMQQFTKSVVDCIVAQMMCGMRCATRALSEMSSTTFLLTSN